MPGIEIDTGPGEAGIAETLIDAKGDLIAGTAADTAGRLAAGANDRVLMADSGETTGLKWVAPATPSTQAVGDAAAEGTGDTFSRGDHKHAMPSADDIHGLAQSITTFTTAAYTLIAGDVGNLVRSSTTFVATVFVPLNASVAISVGSYVDFVQHGSGALGFSTNAGVTMQAATNTTSARAQYSGLTLRKHSTDIWYLFGDTA